MKKLLFTAFITTITLTSQAQVGVSIDLPGTSRKHKGNDETSVTTYEDYIPTKLSLDKLAASTFTDVNGKEFKISDIKKKVIILEFWESWCKPCVTSMGVLNKVQNDYDSTVAVIAVNSLMKDNDDNFKHFVDKNSNKLTYAKCKNLIKEMNVRSVPFKIYLDERGNFITGYEGISESPEKEYEYIKEKIKPHIQK